MKYTIIIWLILVSACSNLKSEEGHYDEYSILLSSLLNVNEGVFTYIDEKGNKQPDELKKFKELERIYIKNISPDLTNNKFSNKRLKIIMFYSFYSFEKKSAAFQEYLAADLMPIYISNPDSFLKILNELPFLIKSNCNRLNANFGFEGKNTYNKSNFLKQNTNL
ncbi:MAG: hypothetical protein GY815_10905, partial [Gammaproteobacteria bacterium]|nr:hypothetical protein [Gammaproteobacteria bacterium]